MDLEVDPALQAFVAEELLPGLDLTPDQFWSMFAGLQERFGGRITELLARRDALQELLDAWHREHGAGDPSTYAEFLTDIGYLVPVPAPAVAVERVDPEIATIAGPQLVVPATVSRYALNAANARWGSLFDALYGTDALPRDHELVRGYDERRGAQVIAEADRLLDELFPLAGGSHAEVTSYLDVEAPQLVGRTERSILLRRNGLHAEIVIGPDTTVGRQHHAGVADVILESAVTTIVDLEDSVATVDGADKAAAYRTWLGLMTGTLSATFEKDGRPVTRILHGDRSFTGPDGEQFSLPGRSMLLVRNVGHHMTTNAVLAGGAEVAEGVLDALVTVTAALHDLRGLGRHRNSRAGSVYVVKPKQHGPDEVALTVELFAAVEAALGLAPATVKIGIMDEEKRTSLNLEACIAAAQDRVIFVNTGFLDRTGDEIHTDFHAGPVVRKDDMKATAWLAGYEDRNVDVALAAGFPGQAQIGKGMWAKPAAMADMLAQKGAQPTAGANCAWVPSPTAATLHALHYLRTDVAARQRELAGRSTDRRTLLEVPLLTGTLSAEQIRHELETNVQSILGYVVRWVGLGIGCSTVPDLAGVGLMEDRATLRISSQLLANWLHHGLVDEVQVREAFARMAALVDEQNADEPGYPPLTPDSESYQAALALVFAGAAEPNGYTERPLTIWRQRVKSRS